MRKMVTPFPTMTSDTSGASLSFTSCKMLVSYSSPSSLLCCFPLSSSPFSSSYSFLFSSSFTFISMLLSLQPASIVTETVSGPWGRPQRNVECLRLAVKSSLKEKTFQLCFEPINPGASCMVAQKDERGGCMVSWMFSVKSSDFPFLFPSQAPCAWLATQQTLNKYL